MCLGHYGFANDWLDLIMECITFVHSSILLNGHPPNPFKIFHTIRQGEPLSSFIFILCMEPLITHLNHLSTTSKTEVGILSSPRTFCIFTFMYANDCLIFSKATPPTARNILKVLDVFSKTSGRQIN